MIPLTQEHAGFNGIGYGCGRYGGNGSGDGPFSVFDGDGLGCGHDDDGYRGRGGGDGLQPETSPLVFVWVSIEASA